MKSEDKPITLIDFHAKWCSPCQTMEPIIERIEMEFGNVVQVLKVDVDDFPKLAQHYKVQNVPTFVLVKDEKIVWQKAGIITFREFKKVFSDSH